MEIRNHTKDKNGTKEKIEQVSLDLFSKKGYHTVSIRDICKEVGIKESTIYYYYKNKKDIMDSLIDKVMKRIEEMKEAFNHAFDSVQEVSEEAMCGVAVGFLQEYLLHPFVYQMISFLAIERMSDETAANVYQKIMFELPLEQQEMVFNQMMKRGYIAENSRKVLAQEYYSVIYFSFQKNCMRGELTEEQKRLTCEEVRSNIKDLYIKMRRQV